MTNALMSNNTFKLLTIFPSLKLSLQLPIEVNHERVLTEFIDVYSHFSPKQRSSVNYEGLKGIGLITSGGNVNSYALLEDKPFLPTPALDLCPYIKDLLDSLPCQKRRVRFMALDPNAEIKWHYDDKVSIDYDFSARLHIPIITSEQIDFRVCHEICHWVPGHLYYGDFSFPHRVKNNSNRTRIHLVIDLVPNDELRSLFTESFSKRRHKRLVLRTLYQIVFRFVRWGNKLSS